MDSTILLTKNEQIATITINRPSAGNAFASTTYEEIKQAIEDLDADESVRVILITGSDKHFSAGGDIVDFKNRIETQKYLTPGECLIANNMTRAVRLCSKPVIAVINGSAVGAGFALALACDFRVMSPGSKLISGFIDMGFSGDTGVIYYLYRLVGMAKTTEIMALSNVISSNEAMHLNLVTSLAKTDETLMDEAMALANRLLKKSRKAFSLQKRMYYDFFCRDIQEFANVEDINMHYCSLSDEHKNAVLSFLRGK